MCLCVKRNYNWNTWYHSRTNTLTNAVSSANLSITSRLDGVRLVSHGWVSGVFILRFFFFLPLPRWRAGLSRAHCSKLRERVYTTHPNLSLWKHDNLFYSIDTIHSRLWGSLLVQQPFWKTLRMSCNKKCHELHFPHRESRCSRTCECFVWTMNAKVGWTSDTSLTWSCHTRYFWRTEGNTDHQLTNA